MLKHPANVFREAQVNLNERQSEAYIIHYRGEALMLHPAILPGAIAEDESRFMPVESGRSSSIAIKIASAGEPWHYAQDRVGTSTIEAYIGLTLMQMQGGRMETPEQTRASADQAQQLSKAMTDAFLKTATHQEMSGAELNRLGWIRSTRSAILSEPTWRCLRYLSQLFVSR